MSSVENYLALKLQERKQEGNFRQLKLSQHPIDFSSNDYLGLAQNRDFAQAILVEIERQHFKTVGATGSRLLSGNHAYTQEVEEQLAQFHQATSALIFNSGFDANYGLLSTLPREGDLILMDEFVHASIHDGARASKAQKYFFKHNDCDHLESLLAHAKERLKYVVIESLYSMEGDLAELENMVAICAKYNAHLIVDEAHATGVIGNQGEGLCQSLGIEQNVFARVVTFGKALGAHGACVLGSQQLKDFLVNYCRPFIFSTALPSHSMATIKVAYDFFPRMHGERSQLAALSAYFNQKNGEQQDWVSPIKKIVVSGNEAVVLRSQQLAEKGIDARAIRYPTVGRGAERIRICLHSYNTKEEIDLLFSE